MQTTEPGHKPRLIDFIATFDPRSQSQLARSLGVGKSRMEAWCASRNRVPPARIPQFAAVLGIDGDADRLTAFWVAAGWPEFAAGVTRRMRRKRAKIAA